MNVIFHADDAGVSIGTNEAIIKAHTDGVLTSTSLRTNGVAYTDMVKKLKKHPKLAVSLHLNLTDGTTHKGKLAGKNGLYKNTFFTYFVRLQLLQDKQLLNDCVDELTYQFEKIENDGIQIDHVDGQDHIHMIPVLFTEIVALCKKRDIQNIRISYEPLHASSLKDFLTMMRTGGVIKRLVLSVLTTINTRVAKREHMWFPEAFYGVLYTSRMTTEKTIDCLLDALKRNYQTIEVALHPAFPHFKEDKTYTSPYFAQYSNAEARQVEFETLTDKNLKEFLRKREITCTIF